VNEPHFAWAAREFDGAQLADRRQVKSLVGIAASLLAHRDRSFSAAVGHAGRQAAHRLFAHPGTTVPGLIHGHVQQTAARCQGQPRVLIAQDTTAFVYEQDETVGLAPLNRREQSVGLLGHAALCLTPEGTPLGLLHLDLWGLDLERPPRQPGARLPLEERESYKWLEGLDAVAQALPAGTQGVLIQDREADMFPLFAAPRPAPLDLLVRAAQNRTVRFTRELAEADLPEEQTGRLFTVAAAAPVVGTHTARVARRSSRPNEVAVPERDAVLTLRVQQVALAPPSGQRRGNAPQTVWVIEAREETPPEGVPALCWVLLTTLAVPDLATARTVVGYYARRWRIERLHFVLKSGLRAERLQIDDATSLTHALAVYYVVAWRLLHLTYVARETPEASARTVLEAEELTVLTAAVGRPVKTVAQVVQAMAKLGGFLPYQKTPPGLKTLWHGWQYLQGLVAGYRLAKSGKPIL
jgi:hypothetical protein